MGHSGVQVHNVATKPQALVRCPESLATKAEAVPLVTAGVALARSSNAAFELASFPYSDCSFPS